MINRTLGKTVQKMGISKYDAFQGMGGQASFALAMLDKENDGMILNCMHSREAVSYTHLDIGRILYSVCQMRRPVCVIQVWQSGR